MKCYDFFPPQAFNFIPLLCFSMSSTYLNCCLCGPESILRHCEVPLPSLSSGSAPVAAERVCVGSCLCRLAQCSQRDQCKLPLGCCSCARARGSHRAPFPRDCQACSSLRRMWSLWGQSLAKTQVCICYSLSFCLGE